MSFKFFMQFMFRQADWRNAVTLSSLAFATALRYSQAFCNEMHKPTNMLVPQRYTKHSHGSERVMKDLNDNKTLELPSMPTLAKRRGRPAKHVDAAARQKAYRERKKAEGMREVKTWTKDVRDTDKVLISDIM